MPNYANSIRSANATMEDIATLIEGAIGSSSNDAASSSWSPTFGAGGSMTYTSVTTDIAKYIIKGPEVTVFFAFNGTTGGTASAYVTFTLPYASANVSAGAQFFNMIYVNQGGTPTVGYVKIPNNSSTASMYKSDESNFSLGATRIFIGQISYLRA